MPIFRNKLACGRIFPVYLFAYQLVSDHGEKKKHRKQQ